MTYCQPSGAVPIGAQPAALAHLCVTFARPHRLAHHESRTTTPRSTGDLTVTDQLATTVRLLGPGRSTELVQGVLRELEWHETRDEVADLWVLDGPITDIIAQLEHRPEGVATLAIVDDQDRDRAFDLLGRALDGVVIMPLHADELRGRLRALMRDPQAGIRSRTLRIFAHDLNNPLTAIRLLSEMLTSEVEDPEIQRDLIDILEASDLAAAHVESLSALSRIESPDAEIPDAECDLHALLAASCARPCMRNYIRFQPLGEAVVVRGQVAAIRQAVRDVVLTARRLAEGHDPILATLTLEGPDAVICLEVPQPGLPGWAEAQLRQPFGAVLTRERRIQVAATGLAHASRAASRHGGELTFSKDEQNPKICLHLPRVHST